MTLVMIVFAGGVICGQEVTLDFTTNSWGLPTSKGKNSTSYTSGTYTITLQASTEYKYVNGYLLIGKANSSLTLPAFDFDVEKIVVEGNTNGSTSVKQNIFVGTESVSAETTGCNKNNTYTISKDYQAAGNIYTLKVTSKHNTQITKILIYKKNAADDRTTTSLSFGEEYDGKTITKYIGDENIYSIPATLSPSVEGATITYKSSNSELVEVDSKGYMMICGTEPGSATITAEYAGDDTYAPSSVSYTVQVKKPVAVEDGVFDFTSGELDYGSGLTAKTGSAYGSNYDKNTKWVNGVIELSTTGGTRWIQDDNDLYVFRVYSSQNSVITISVPNSYIITKIDFGKCKSGLTSSTGIFLNGIWTGNSNSITFKATDKKDIDIITLTYYKALTTAASSFATYAADDAIDYSAAGLAAYAIELNEAEGKVAYNEISGTVEAGTPVLVKGEASTSYAMIPSTATATAVTTALQISDGNVTAADNLYYGFATLNGVSGFKLVQNGVTIPAKKGYLKLSSSDNAKTFYAFDGNTTGIEETFSKNDAEKALAPMYNISGQRVGEGYKGIVIVNGKKYVK